MTANRAIQPADGRPDEASRIAIEPEAINHLSYTSSIHIPAEEMGLAGGLMSKSNQK